MKTFARIPAPLPLALIAFGLYLPGFWWGAPHATAADPARKSAGGEE